MYRNFADFVKGRYPVGTRIKLTYTFIGILKQHVGKSGRVIEITEFGHLMVQWDGEPIKSLLDLGTNEFTVLS